MSSASPTAFPVRRRRLMPASFLSPKLSAIDLLRSLHSLSSDIASLHPPLFILKSSSASIIRKCRIISVIFDEISRSPRQFEVVTCSSPSYRLCFDEMFIVLQRIRALIEDCSNRSRIWPLMQIELFSSSFHELTLDLRHLLEIFPGNELNLSEEVNELKNLAFKQCRREDKSMFTDTTDTNLRIEVLNTLDSIRREIVPDHSSLGEIFTKLGLTDSASCREEIDSLEDEIQRQNDEKSKSDAVALIGLIRYAKCVLFGPSSPTSNEKFRRTVSELNIPTDFRCPITLDLMTDPVVVATGQTYDRSSITLWLESGHKTCPKTGQTLTHMDMIPNTSLKNFIATWCRQQRVPYMATTASKDKVENGLVLNKVVLEATKMTVSFLLTKLTSTSDHIETINRVIYELRVLAKSDSDSRAHIAELGGIPMLVRHLGPDLPSLQANAVTTILNLSILNENKTRVMETDGALNGIIEVLRSGATWEAKGNAAVVIFSLSGENTYRKRLGKKTRVIRGLLELAKDGPVSSKRDALAAILTLAGDKDAAGKLVESGVVDLIMEAMDELPEESITILETVVKKGGFVAVAAASHTIEKLVGLLRNGTDRAKESAIATLVVICRKGGAEMVAELAKISTIEVVIWELMGNGTARAKRKAASIMRILRRWTVGFEETLEGFSMTMALR